MIYAVGHISGAPFNPAVTVAFASVGQFPWTQVPLYVTAQLLAALIGSGLLRCVIDSSRGLGETVPSGTAAQPLAVEAILTFILMFVITAVATDARAEGAMAGWAVGGTVTLAAIFAGPVSGASMNPARSLGPALVAGNMPDAWIYILGPLTGATLGAWAYRTIRCGGEERRAEGCC